MRDLETIAIASQIADRDAERRFFTAVAATAAVIAVLGFARTYYLKGAFDTPALPALVHLHGVVMTAWLVLLAAQARLIAARRIDLHRRVGVFGAALAALVVVVGTITAIDAARRGVTPGPPPLVFLAIPLSVVVVFALFVGAALYLRTRSDYHKRLMALASLTVIQPAVARLAVDVLGIFSPPLFFALTDALVLVFVAWDTVTNRRLHPAFGWGVLFFLLSQPARFLVAVSAGWMRFATWLVG